MRTTPNDPATCWHEDLDVRDHEVRRGGQLVRVDVHIVCRDCERLLQREIHTLPIGEAK